ncbi:hypothetical protein [Prosthecobacter debontii]|nr:hypothetical protein [Prosthecobacter debontii]
MISEKEKCYIQAFISSNLDSMYKRTHSFEIEKYFKLFKLIIKKRLETGFLTTTDFKNKTLKLKLKPLTEEQIKALEWINNNELFLKENIEFLLKRRKK